MKNISKRVMAAVLVLIMTIGMVGNAYAVPFVDVGVADWFYEDVRYVFERDVMSGTSVETFNPNMPVTRAMAVQVLYNRAGRPGFGIRSNGFTDVSEGAWYYDAVVWAVTNGIASGVGGNIFAPDENISREDLAVMLNNYAEYSRVRLPALRDGARFADDADIRSYAREAIDRFYRAMIIGGRPDGSFDPQGSATRAELAAMLAGFIRFSVNSQNPPDDEPLPMPEYGYPIEEFPVMPVYGIPLDEEFIMPPYGFPSP
ncbi:MAG: S-layer homology domain-containing protein [Clostridiales bacterium]|jgi:hypothetical protein|nr:S-layer homology domain-containing protein [Clostridiales bacterium]